MTTWPALDTRKARAEMERLEADPPTELFLPRLDIRRRWSVLLLSLLTPILLLISFPPFDVWPLAYVALVPWSLAAISGHSGRWAVLWSYLAGVVFWGLGVYWLTWVTGAGFAALILYLGSYWLVAGWTLRRAFARGWPMWLCLPVIWVAMEYARSLVISGFPWFNLALSQHANLRLIQIVDATGQYGVSFFVALVNGVLVDLLSRPLFKRCPGGARPRRLVWLPAAATLALAGAMLGYGQWRIAQTESVRRPGPTLGVVQRAFPNSVVIPGATGQEMFDAHHDASRRLIGRHVDVVVWPEAMLGHPQMDPAFWARRATGGQGESEGGRTIERDLGKLQALVTDLDCPLLAGGSMLSPNFRPDELLLRNTAILYEVRDGRLTIANRYAKRHLVPFGEYVPFREDWPGLHHWLRSFVPSEMPQLEPGTEITRFTLPWTTPGGLRETCQFAVPICYEGVFDRVCRDMVYADGRKIADMLVNISNDGWFIYTGDGYTHASSELEQHLAQYVFRAIENRVPVVRAVNTGISASIDSTGRVVSCLQRNGQRKMVTGEMVAPTWLDERASFYGWAGDWFCWVISAAAVVGAIGLLRRRPKVADDGTPSRRSPKKL